MEKLTWRSDNCTEERKNPTGQATEFEPSHVSIASRCLGTLNGDHNLLWSELNSFPAFRFPHLPGASLTLHSGLLCLNYHGPTSMGKRRAMDMAEKPSSGILENQGEKNGDGKILASLS